MALTNERYRYEKELLAIHEEMRQYFAQELHDNIGHQIACLRISFENLKLDIKDGLPMIEQVDQYIEEASSN